MSAKPQSSQYLPPVSAQTFATLREMPIVRGTCSNKSPNLAPPLSLRPAEYLVDVLSGETTTPFLSVDRDCLGRHSDSLSEHVVSRIKAIFMSENGAKLVHYLSGENAQTLIDVVHETVDLSGLPPPLRRKCLSTLCRICGRQALLPRSLQIPLCYDRSSVPRYRGGCADVWKGEYQGHPVAAKVVRVYLTSDLERITRKFCKEVMTWNTLDHPNVLPLLGVTMDDQQFVMVSEWMSNGNINQFIQTHKDANRFELLEDIARGLIYMHDQEMVHGDLKGANILVDQNGHARLADFGFLTIISDPTNPTVSSSFTVGGTIRWMSPELFLPDKSGLKGTRPTKQSDCYAFGMVIYEVLSGQVPFAQFHHCVVMWKVIEGERPSKPDAPEGAQFTDDLWETLSRCWAAQPQRRPSVTTVLECLERVSRAVTTPSEQSDVNTGTDEGDWEISRDSSRVISRLSPRNIATFLRKILSQLQAIFRKVLPSKRGGTGVSTSQPTTFTQGHL